MLQTHPEKPIRSSLKFFSELSGCCYILGLHIEQNDCLHQKLVRVVSTLGKTQKPFKWSSKQVFIDIF